MKCDRVRREIGSNSALSAGVAAGLTLLGACGGGRTGLDEIGVRLATALAATEAPAGDCAPGTEQREAADVAFDGCRFGKAEALYRALAEDGADCSTQLARIAEGRVSLDQVEAHFVEGACHRALAVLPPEDRFARCRMQLSSCEAQEFAQIEAEVERSERELNRELDGLHVDFVQTDDRWVWDIHVRGPWRDASGGNTLVTLLGLICEAIGEESRNTRWTSRDLRFVEEGACYAQVPTRLCREALRNGRTIEAVAQQALVGCG